MTLPTFAAERRSVQHGTSSYRSISAADAGAQQQTRRPPLLLSIDGRDRRAADGRTPDRCIENPASHAGSINKPQQSEMERGCRDLKELSHQTGENLTERSLWLWQKPLVSVVSYTRDDGRIQQSTQTHTHTHPFNSPFPGLPG